MSITIDPAVPLGLIVLAAGIAGFVTGCIVMYIIAVLAKAAGEQEHLEKLREEK